MVGGSGTASERRAASTTSSRTPRPTSSSPSSARSSASSARSSSSRCSLAILHLGLKIAYLAPDPFGRTVAAALTAWIVGQAFINIGTVIGLLPITGVTLPLVSVGWVVDGRPRSSRSASWSPSRAGPSSRPRRHASAPRPLGRAHRRSARDPPCPRRRWWHRRARLPGHRRRSGADRRSRPTSNRSSSGPGPSRGRPRPRSRVPASTTWTPCRSRDGCRPKLLRSPPGSAPPCAAASRSSTRRGARRRHLRRVRVLPGVLGGCPTRASRWSSTSRTRCPGWPTASPRGGRTASR